MVTATLALLLGLAIYAGLRWQPLALVGVRGAWLGGAAADGTRAFWIAGTCAALAPFVLVIGAWLW